MFREALQLLLALMLMVLVVVLWRAVGGYRIARAPRASDVVTRSLRRGAFSGGTRDVTDERFARVQAEEMLGRPITADEARAARDELADIRRVPRAEFHLRHVLADSVIRRLTMMFLRAPSEVGYRRLRSLFAALGADGLLGLWDGLYRDLRDHDGNWYAVLGPRGAAQLRRYITNLRGNLFLSESQGNLHAGTMVDITAEGVRLVGRREIERIVDETVRTLEAFGLGPRIHLVHREFLLGDEDAVGELFRYGYSRARTHDVHLDPLRFMSVDSAEIVLRNTEPGTLVAYLRDNWRVGQVVFSCLLLLVAFYLSRYPLDRLYPPPGPDGAT